LTARSAIIEQIAARADTVEFECEVIPGITSIQASDRTPPDSTESDRARPVQITTGTPAWQRSLRAWTPVVMLDGRECAFQHRDGTMKWKSTGGAYLGTPGRDPAVGQAARPVRNQSKQKPAPARPAAARAGIMDTYPAEEGRAAAAPITPRNRALRTRALYESKRGRPETGSPAGPESAREQTSSGFRTTPSGYRRRHRHTDR